MLRFYDRQAELAALKKIETLSRSEAQMTFVVGRRRVGKTALLSRAFQANTLYFFVSKKSESLLCAEFTEEIQTKLKTTIFGTITAFADIFGYLMELSASRPFTLIIDEFQEFQFVNPSIYSDMQRIWDRGKDAGHINLILCGSIYSLMKQIFEQSKEPLFGRSTGRLHVQPFSGTVLKEILQDHYPKYKSDDLLAFYMVSGGVARYAELLTSAGAFTLDSILNEIFSGNSPFLDEGRNMLIDEFGKEYGNYFSILTLIASSKTSRTEIESIMGIQTGGFLDRLENDFGLVTKVRPIFSKPGSRSVKYRISDNFLRFWFRFIYKYRGTVEIRNFSYIKDLVKREYPAYSGMVLERYFTGKLAAEGKFSAIGSWWDRSGQNEIDIVAVNEYEKQALIAEVKRQKGKIDLTLLQKKAEPLLPDLGGYRIEYRGFSLADL
jgi:AAA+ ATPase superfamily predicted ATPase